MENDVINSIEITRKKHKNYTIIKYDKNKCLQSNYYCVGYKRCCMVVDRDQDRIVCVGPTKINSLNDLDDFSNVALAYEEFVDGVMINVFWEESNKRWQYARSNIGADIRFYVQNEGKKTFRTMFDEALVHDKVSLDVLPKTMCYTFVFAAPRQPNCSTGFRTHVVLVEAHEITDKIITIYPHGSTDADKELRAIINQYDILFLNDMHIQIIKQATDNHASRNTDFSCVGVMVKNYETGWRSKIRNPVYEEVKLPRGNHPKCSFFI